MRIFKVFNSPRVVTTLIVRVALNDARVSESINDKVSLNPAACASARVSSSDIYLVS